MSDSVIMIIKQVTDKWLTPKNLFVIAGTIPGAAASGLELRVVDDHSTAPSCCASVIRQHLQPQKLKLDQACSLWYM